MKYFINKKEKTSGFSLMEVLVVLGVLALVVSIVFSGFNSFSKTKSVGSDAETIVEILRQARNETIASKNSSAYGVHFSGNTMTIFVGPTYSAGAATNRVISLPSNNTSLTLSLTGGVSYVLFAKISGETNQNGTITVSSSGVTGTKTVTIYKTGIVEMN
ncbi:MAG: GspH/FimT family protein [Patescibacteria group bacterium]